MTAAIRHGLASIRDWVAELLTALGDAFGR